MGPVERGAPQEMARRPGSRKAPGEVRAMFDRLASRYDRFNRLASLFLDTRWRRQAIRSLGQGHDWLLDLAAGTGDLALLALEERVARRAIALDFSHPMLQGAVVKARRVGPYGHLAPVMARAEALPNPGEVFGAATSAFAMRNVRGALDAVLSELYRVLSPGGRLSILEFGEPPGRILRGLHRVYLRRVMPLVGRLLTGDAEPFLYLRESILDFDQPTVFIERLRRAGFNRPGFRRLTWGTVVLYTAHKDEERD